MHTRPDPLAERVLGRIESERLHPRPRWAFIAKNYVFWALGAFAVVFGALAVAATLFELTAVDWRLSVATHPDFFSFFLSAAPILWVVALALFIGLGYANIRHTRHGYRYALPVIALGAVLTSLTLGSALYLAGFGERIEMALGDHPPFYRPILVAERAWWSAPDRGLLLGDVATVGSGLSSFTLRDTSGKDWTVDSTDLHERDLAAIARGGTLRVVGLPVSTTTATSTAPASTTPEFHACFVFPWNAPEGGQGGGPLPMPLAAPTSTGMMHRMRGAASNSPCQGIRPYRELHNLDTESDGD